jgi:hypothetical protein
MFSKHTKFRFGSLTELDLFGEERRRYQRRSSFTTLVGVETSKEARVSQVESLARTDKPRINIFEGLDPVYLLCVAQILPVYSELEDF